MSSVITITTQPPVDPPSPTPTHFDLRASEIVAAFDVLLAILPMFEEAIAADEKQVRKNLNVPDSFCNTAISGVEQLPEMEAAKKLYAEKSRMFMQFYLAFRPVDDKLDAVSRHLKHALRFAKSFVAGSSLHIYRIARAQASDGKSPAMTGFVAALKRDLARRIRTREERAQRKAAKLQAAVEEALQQAAVEQALAKAEKEVKAA